MLNSTTRNRINACRDILVGKIPDPKGQIDQITNALVYKFMDDQDRMSRELGYDASFFVGDFEQYAWSRLFDTKLTNQDKANLYSEGLDKLSRAKHLPDLFKEIFKDAYLPFRDANTIVMFLNEINGFDYHHSEELGNAFEYLLSIMGSQGDAGQFRTPRHIIQFLVDVVDPKKSETILDPACGTAGFLVEAFKHISTKGGLSVQDTANLANNITGVDIDPGMAKIARVNLYLHGFKTPKISENDTLTNEKLWGTKYDVILANPPFMTPKGGIQPHDKFAIRANRAEVLFTDYIAEHLKLHGRAGIIVPEGIIFQSSNAYKDLRKMLIDDGYLWAVVSLPAGCFNPYSGVKTSILFLDRDRAKKNHSILFVKISNDGYDLGAQRREGGKNDLPKALEILNKFKDNPKFDLENEPLAHLVEKAKIAENGDYNLSGDRYILSTSSVSTEFEMVELGEVCDLQGGGTPSRTNENYWGGDIPWITSKYFSDDGKINGFEGITQFGLEKSSSKIAPKNSTILITRVSVGKYAFADRDYAINQDLTALIPKEKILAKYLFWMSSIIAVEVKKNANGVGVTGVNRDFVKSIKIPLAPLEIQEQIVAELDGYQRIIDGARAVLESYKPTIKIDPEWEMVELGEVCFYEGGTQPPKSTFIYEPKDGYIRLLQIRDYKSDDNAAYIPKTARHKICNKNDIMIGRYGPPVFQILKGKEGAYNVALMKCVPNNSKITNDWLYYFLQSTPVQQKIIGLSERVRQSGVRPDDLNKLKIPLPSLKIQQSIVDRIEEERKLVDANRRLIEIYEQKIKEKMDEVWGVGK